MSFIAEVFPYLAFGLFVAGTAWRVVHWLRQPPHLKWTLHPVPKGLSGQIRYMVTEIFTFETVYRFNRPLWIGTYALHMAMGWFVLFALFYILGWATSMPVKLFLWVMVGAAVYILWLRLSDRNLKALSSGEEYFNLLFLILTAAAFLFAASVPGMSPRDYLRSIVRMQPGARFLVGAYLPALLLGGLFLIYLPWSKMIHYVSKYFTYHRINWEKEK